MGSKDNNATKKIHLTKAKKNKSVNIKAKDLEASLKREPWTTNKLTYI